MTKTYEGMFLLDAGDPDFEAAAAPVRELLDRAQAEVLSLKPWDDRRLAYDIEGRRRGLYVLAYFKAEPERIAEMDHDIQLSEKILRAMVLSADHVKDERIQAETPATLAAARRASIEADRAQKAAHQARQAQGQPQQPAEDKPGKQEPPAEGEPQPEEKPQKQEPAPEAEQPPAAEGEPPPSSQEQGPVPPPAEKDKPAGPAGEPAEDSQQQ